MRKYCLEENIGNMYSTDCAHAEVFFRCSINFHSEIASKVHLGPGSFSYFPLMIWTLKEFVYEDKLGFKPATEQDFKLGDVVRNQ